MSYTSIDLFSGPGGICTGFKWAGIKPLIAVEFSYWTTQTYKSTHNADIFPLEDYLNGQLENSDEFFKPSDKTLLIYGDVRLVSNDLIMEILAKRFNTDTVDIVTGGAPCESFSMQGDRKEDDERNNLFLNIVRIARSVNSKMVLFENVKGLLSKKSQGISGKMFEDICDEFERIDGKTGGSYKLASRNAKEVLLKASDYGVPQNRERIFLVGINSKYEAQYTYPEITHGPEGDKPYVTVKDALFDLPQIDFGQVSEVYDFNFDNIQEQHRSEFVRCMRGVNTFIPDHLDYDISTTISSHKAINHTEKMRKRMHLILQGESMKTAVDRLLLEGKENDVKEFFPNKIFGSRNRRLREDQPCFTVTSHCLDEMIHPNFDRGLTPREAARLQSFPDWYQFEGHYVKFHSDPEQDRYEQIGDAIPPLMAFALGKQVVKSLEEIQSISEIKIGEVELIKN